MMQFTVNSLNVDRLVMVILIAVIMSGIVAGSVWVYIAQIIKKIELLSTRTPHRQTLLIIGSEGTAVTDSIISQLIQINSPSTVKHYNKKLSLWSLLKFYDSISADTSTVILTTSKVDGFFMSRLIRAVCPQTLVITDIDSTDENREITNYVKLLATLAKQTNVILNWDNLIIRKLPMPVFVRINRIGTSSIVEYKLKSFDYRDNFQHFELENGTHTYKIVTNYVSKNSSLYAVLGLASLVAMGHNITKLIPQLHHIQHSGAALRVFEQDWFVLVDNSMNTTMSGLMNALEFGQSFSGKLIWVWGHDSIKSQLLDKNWDRCARILRSQKPSIIILLGTKTSPAIVQKLKDAGMTTFDILQTKQNTDQAMITRIKKELSATYHADSSDLPIIILEGCTSYRIIEGLMSIDFGIK